MNQRAAIQEHMEKVNKNKFGKQYNRASNNTLASNNNTEEQQKEENKKEIEENKTKEIRKKTVPS